MDRDRTSRPVPLRALILSLASLTVPVAWALLFPDWAADELGMLVWLAALIPAFLFTYYRGWEGSSVALAAGMAVLTSTQVFLLVSGIGSPDWNLVLVVVLLYLAISFGIGLMAELLHRERRAAEEMAFTDPLTKLPNRRHATLFLEATFAAAERGTPMAVVIFDVDHFKRFNDTYGHDAGDEVLIQFAEVLTEQTRQMNMSARWGGEEFISILAASDAEGARIFADRVRDSLAGQENRWGRVTVSGGVAAHAPGMESPDLLVAAADQALYRAKEEGRNRIALASEGPGETEAADAEAGATAGEPREATPRDQETILVVEDDDDTRRAVARTLEFHGYRVVEAPTGEAALELVDRRTDGVDLVVTDIVMPGMSGFTLVDRLVARRPGTRVVYMSGYSHDDVSWDGVPGSATTFLKKPMSVEELGTVVREMLDIPT